MNRSKPNLRFHRRSIRLKEFDYSSENGYFITCVTRDRYCLFGQIVKGEMLLNEFGEIVRKEWFHTAELRPNIELMDDEFVVMPNHIHGIIWITNGSRGTLQRAPTPTIEQFGKPVSNSIPTIIRLFKSTTTKQINLLRQTPGKPVWQRNYYEHVIRSENDYENHADYIENNPLGWEINEENLVGN